MRRAPAAIVVTITAMALAGCSVFQDRAIVAGVPAQVDSKQHDTYGNPFSPLWQNDYTVTIEQCDIDIKIAKISESVSNPSYDPATDSVAFGCFSVSYLVSASTYAKYQLGTQVTFAGNVGTPVQAIG